ncbi:MAG: zinc ribbon domain-containing protein [Candidatus Diapherotrites archaeon]|nr:zinc ribbon domain-containing protein [Candidatus Diapherotrites archaeon]
MNCIIFERPLFIGILCILIALAFAGCSQPISPETSVQLIELRANETALITYEFEGPLTEEAEDWAEGDCTMQITIMIDGLTAMLQAADLSGSMTAEEKQELEESLAMLQEIRRDLRCNFTKNGDSGKLVYSFVLTKSLMQKMNEMNESPEDQTWEIEKNSEGNIRAILIPDVGFGIKSVKVKVQGELTEIKPDYYTSEGGYMVFSPPPILIEAEFIPEETGFFGIPFEIIIAIIAIIAAALIALYFLKFRKRKPRQPKILPQAKQQHMHSARTSRQEQQLLALKDQYEKDAGQTQARIQSPSQEKSVWQKPEEMKKRKQIIEQRIREEEKKKAEKTPSSSKSFYRKIFKIQDKIASMIQEKPKTQEPTGKEAMKRQEAQPQRRETPKAPVKKEKELKRERMQRPKKKYVPRRMRRFYREGQAEEREFEDFSYEQPRKRQSSNYDDSILKELKHGRETRPEAMDIAIDEITQFKKEHNRMPRKEDYELIADNILQQLPKEARTGRQREEKPMESGKARERYRRRREKKQGEKAVGIEKPFEETKTEPQNTGSDLNKELKGLEIKDILKQDSGDSLESLDSQAAGNEEFNLSGLETGETGNKCPNCKQSTEDILFCPECGSAFCQKCAKKEQIGSQTKTVCPKCGKKID